MEIVLRTALGDLELDLDLGSAAEDISVEELAMALDPTAGAVGSALVIDDVQAHCHWSLSEAGLVTGSIVEFATATRQPATAVAGRHGEFQLVVVGGPQAGETHDLSGGGFTVGRGAAADIKVADATLSPLHLRLRAQGQEISVQDLGSHNGSFVGNAPVRSEVPLVPGESLRMGAVEAVVRRRVLVDRPFALHPSRSPSRGLVPFNRPPRVAPIAGTNEIPVPNGAMEANRTAVFNFAALLGPIIMGAVMVKVMGNIRYALFALMSPIMLISSHLAARRRYAKDSKSSRRRFKSDLDDFAARMDVAVVEERRRRAAAFPDAGEVVRRCAVPSTRLWERRSGDLDYLHLRIGCGPFEWSPPVDQRRLAAATEFEATVSAASVISQCVITVDLSRGGVVGLVGDRVMALALARSLVLQACVFHGPADLPLVVLTDTRGAAQWDWTKWLPHSRSQRGPGRLLSETSETSGHLMESIGANLAHSGEGPAMFLVVDDETLTVGRSSPTRAVLGGRAGRVAGLVLASSADRLPAICDNVIVLRGSLGDAELHQPQLARSTEGIAMAGMAEPLARECARKLARFEDPELDGSEVGLASMVTLLDVLGTDSADPVAVRQRWAEVGPVPDLRAPIGLGLDGIVELSLVADGPHMLLGGTTGSGKSELLRSLVGALASRFSPDHLVFVLIDYKGGSAFDECSRLPHTVGMVTDLDDHLGERALRSLDAELRHREEVLRQAGATDLQDYLCMGTPLGAMPRLVIAVDEFASLAAELPEFIGSLVGVAQRGRSLGVHLILATQRPSGAVNANIKANTNIRVALRVQDAQDSIDVIGSAAAHDISRTSPGRACIRLGPDDVVAVQTALSGAVSGRGGRPEVAIRPFRFGPGSVSHPAAAVDGQRTDLVRVVDACGEAFRGLPDVVPPRRPWLEMLGDSIPLIDLLGGVEPGPLHDLVLGVADDPAHQSQPVLSWAPTSGHLAFVGALGSGTTTALVSTAVSAAYATSPDQLHMYGIDFGGGALGALVDLAHVGAIVEPDEHERQVRLVSLLVEELGRRRALTALDRARQPQIILLIDGSPAFLSQYSGVDGQETADGFRRVMSDGVGVGISVALAMERISAVPMVIMNTVGRRILLEQVDDGDFASIGVRARTLPDFVSGRGIDSASQLVVQVASVEDVAGVVANIAARWGSARLLPLEVAPLPTEVTTADMTRHLVVGEPLLLPIGISECDRSVASLAVHAGEHIFIAGSARSGVSTTIRALARMLKLADPNAVMVAVVGVRSPLWADSDLYDAIGSLDQLVDVLAVAARGDGRQWVVVVDDAHLVEEADILVAVAGATGHCRMLVGGRAEDLHGQFRHWTRGVRRSGLGVLLSPRLDADGDLLGVRLPRRLSVPLVPGRGFLVTEGESVLVQVAGADLAAA